MFEIRVDLQKLNLVAVLGKKQTSVLVTQVASALCANTTNCENIIKFLIKAASLIKRDEVCNLCEIKQR